jgi:hypothetical protein
VVWLLLLLWFVAVSFVAVAAVVVVGVVVVVVVVVVAVVAAAVAVVAVVLVAVAVVVVVVVVVPFFCSTQFLFCLLLSHACFLQFLTRSSLRWRRKTSFPLLQWPWTYQPSHSTHSSRSSSPWPS